MGVLIRWIISEKMEGDPMESKYARKELVSWH